MQSRTMGWIRSDKIVVELQALTPKIQAKSKMWTDPPIRIDELIELMRPGRFGVTETSRETAALQFYYRRY